MERTHIAFFGRRNAGKSSLVNRFTSQELSIVSDVAGTTTDPVRKTMELLPLGPVIIIDTPGIDDEGQLGNQRIERSIRVLDETDIAILVVDGSIGIADDEKQLIDEFKKRRIPYLVVMNKSDLGMAEVPEDAMVVSALKGEGIEELKEKVAVIISQRKSRPLVSDLVEEGDLVVLVVPIDKSAPKDRLILPQQMV
jgi:[FeFe] hydrogenase H-cluster maturation GTPase HydF